MFECELRYENLFESEREMFECEQKIESPQGTRMSTVFRYENLFESEREDEKCSSVNKRSNLPKVRE